MVTTKKKGTPVKKGATARKVKRPNDSAVEVLLRYPGIDPDRLMTEGVDFNRLCRKCRGTGQFEDKKTGPGTCPDCNGEGSVIEPLYTVGEIGKVFFARSGHWVRWREGQKAFIYEGEEPGSRTEHGARSFTLYDVERMAHALAMRNHLEPRNLMLVLNVVRSQAMLYGYMLPGEIDGA